MRRDRVAWMEGVLLRLPDMSGSRLLIEDGEVKFQGEEAVRVEFWCQGPLPGNHSTFEFVIQESNPKHKESVRLTFSLNERQTEAFVTKIIRMLLPNLGRSNAEAVLSGELRDQIKSYESDLV